MRGLLQGSSCIKRIALRRIQGPRRFPSLTPEELQLLQAWELGDAQPPPLEVNAELVLNCINLDNVSVWKVLTMGAFSAAEISYGTFDPADNLMRLHEVEYQADMEGAAEPDEAGFEGEDDWVPPLPPPPQTAAPGHTARWTDIPITATFTTTLDQFTEAQYFGTARNTVPPLRGRRE